MAQEIQDRKWTVIGYYEDSLQSYSEWVEADDEHDAFAKVAKSNSGVTLVGASHGWRDVHAPCEDSGQICAAEDYPVD
jgi:hypothetical protein